MSAFPPIRADGRDNPLSPEFQPRPHAKTAAYYRALADEAEKCGTCTRCERFSLEYLRESVCPTCEAYAAEHGP